jgi:hypothetical protein
MAIDKSNDNGHLSNLSQFCVIMLAHVLIPSLYKSGHLICTEFIKCLNLFVLAIPYSRTTTLQHVYLYTDPDHSCLIRVFSVCLLNILTPIYLMILSSP